MKVKWPIFAVPVAFLVFLMSSGSEAVNTRLIDGVLKKSVLDRQDLQIIDNFVDEAVRELVKTIDGLESLRLTDLAIGKLKDKNTVVRYWAVHCLTNSNIIKKLNAGGTSNLKLARSIVAELNKLVESSRAEIISLIAKFAAGVNIQEAEDLLVQIADMRIKRYARWTVEYELLDGDILKSLSSKIATTDPSKTLTTTSRSNSAVARRFGQLYSYVIQRYVKGKGLLSDTQKNQLVSVMVETEDKCIGKLLGRTQTAIKRAIEADNTTALLREHNRLLGCKTAAGQLPLKLKFEYSSTGGNRTTPVPLPEPPKNNSVK